MHGQDLETQEVLGGCWACGSFKKSLKWNGTRFVNLSTLQMYRTRLIGLNH